MTQDCLHANLRDAWLAIELWVNSLDMYTHTMPREAIMCKGVTHKDGISNYECALTQEEETIRASSTGTIFLYLSVCRHTVMFYVYY